MYIHSVSHRRRSGRFGSCSLICKLFSHFYQYLVKLLVMAKSKSFFGMRRGSTKSLTFQVVNGQQVTKERVSSVKNPKTSGQAVQRMKLAPAQKFYNAFADVCNHSYQGVAYGEKSRQHFMSEAMKQNGGPYVVKGFNGLVPGTYLVSQGSIPEVILTTDWDGRAVETSLNMEEFNDRAGFVDAVLVNNPWLQEGDKLTILFCMNYSGIFYAQKKQVVLKAALSANESDDYAELYQTFGVKNDKLIIALDDAPFATAYSYVCSIAIIISRGTGQTADARSDARMYVDNDIIAQFYSSEAYEIAMASYQSESANPVGDEWYLNNFAIGNIGRVAAETVTVNGNTTQVLVLIITEAGLNKKYLFVQGQYCILPSGARAPFQPSATGLTYPTAPWDSDYLRLFSGFNSPGQANFAAAQAARLLGCDMSDLKIYNLERVDGKYEGGQTFRTNLAVAFNGRNYSTGDPIVILYKTDDGDGHTVQPYAAVAEVDNDSVVDFVELEYGKWIADLDLSEYNVAGQVSVEDGTLLGYPYASAGPHPAPVPPVTLTAKQQICRFFGVTEQQFDTTYGGGSDKRVFIPMLFNSTGEDYGLAIAVDYANEALEAARNMGVSEAAIASAVFIGSADDKFTLVDLQHFAGPQTTIAQLITSFNATFVPENMLSQIHKETSLGVVSYDSSIGYMNQVLDV